MTEQIYHQFNGLVFGYKPGDPYAFGLSGGDGLEDTSMTDGILPPRGADGRGIAPMWADPGGWVTELTIHEGDPGVWAERRDALRAGTSPVLDRSTELPYDMVYNDEDVRTRFGRPGRRIIPTNEQYLVRRVLDAQIAFTASDPYTYGPDTESDPLSAGDTLPMDSTGWAFSQRWTWVVQGPATRPQIALTVDGFDDQILRYNGTVSGGSELRVESTPNGLVTTLDGVNVFGSFDGGTGVELPGFFSIPPGEQVLLYDNAGGAGTSVFTWRTAMY
jgi:hypothetical protein